MYTFVRKVIFFLITTIFDFTLLDKFNTSVDIKLREWAENELATLSIQAGRQALREEFSELMSKSSDSDVIYDSMKKAAVDEALSRHQWEERAQDVSFDIRPVKVSLLYTYLNVKTNTDSKNTRKALLAESIVTTSSLQIWQLDIRNLK